jgi:serine/threonine protein kinase
VGTRPIEIARVQAAADRKRKALMWAAAVLLSAPILVVAFKRKPPPAKNRRQVRTRAYGVPAPGQPTATAPVPVIRPRPAEIEAMLARYQLIERIGEGSTAEVFTAISQGGGAPRRSLVIKRLKAELTENAAAVAHFTDESALLSRLSHPNLLPVYDCGEVDGTFFIAEEYVVGRDLARITRKLMETGRPPLSAAALLYVAHEILAGLGYLHAACPGQNAPAGFLHHDLSPHGVIVSRLGKVKLLDFRIIRAHEQAAPEIGGAKTNIEFLSPEQARGRPLDHRSDLFSLGLVLYQCAAREPLYRGDTQYDRISRAAHGPGPQEQARINALPSPLPALLLRALEPHPDRRFQSAAEFATAVAPHITGGEDEVAGVISDLFDDDLQKELDGLSAAGPAPIVAARPDRRPGAS